MKDMFKKFCAPLMLINNNVYTFLSGIIISLSINIFSTICIEETDVISSWHLYGSFILYLISGGLFIYIATRISSYQDYMSHNQIIIFDEKIKIIMDFEEKKAIKWFLVFISLIITTLGGSALLLLNYIL